MLNIGCQLLLLILYKTTFPLGLLPYLRGNYVFGALPFINTIPDLGLNHLPKSLESAFDLSRSGPFE